MVFMASLDPGPMSLQAVFASPFLIRSFGEGVDLTPRSEFCHRSFHFFAAPSSVDGTEVF
jgi:hypothetical protein